MGTQGPKRINEPFLYDFSSSVLLSYCKIQLFLSSKCWTDECRLPCSIFKYANWSIVPSKSTKLPTTSVAIQSQNITLPPLCLTVGIKFSGFISMFIFCQNFPCPCSHFFKNIFSLIYKPILPKSLSISFDAKSNFVCWFEDEMIDFLLRTLPLKPANRRILRVISGWTFLLFALQYAWLIFGH